MHGGEYDAETLFIAPTIVDNVQPNHPLMQDEIFGPILPVLEYENIEDAERSKSILTEKHREVYIVKSYNKGVEING